MSSYMEKIFWTLLKTSFTKKSFSCLLMSLTTIFIRSHIDGFLAYIFNTPFYLCNTIIHISISMFLITKSKYIYNIIARYEPEYYSLVKYLINNYNEKNFKRWKLKINMSICIYLYLLTFFINISNENIRQIIIEYVMCYFLIEFYEKYTTGNIQILLPKEYECSTKDNEIIDDLIKSNNNFDTELFDIKKS
jgi:hypothetical protein